MHRSRPGHWEKGHNEVYLLTSRQRLQHRWYWPDPNWSPWENMGLPSGPVTVVAAGSKGLGHARSWRSRPATRCTTAGGRTTAGQGNEMPRLGTPVADLAFSSNCEGALEIFARPSGAESATDGHGGTGDGPRVGR